MVNIGDTQVLALMSKDAFQTKFHSAISHLITASLTPLLSCLHIGWEGRCKVAPESWVIGGSKVVSSKGLEGYKMFDPRDSRREDREEENA